MDLGINTDAVCSIMRSDGTVLDRKFINFPSEKDRLSHVLGRIRRFQKEHGSKQIGSRWAYAKRLNTELARKTARSIAEYAHENHADVIVFEYLEMKGKISGKKRQKLHLWKKREIQTMCKHKAHRYGIRVSRVCAWNTSRLAYDGSGPVSRDPKNHSLCVFQSGEHTTTVDGNGKDPGRKELLAVGITAGMKKNRCMEIIDEIEKCVGEMLGGYL